MLFASDLDRTLIYSKKFTENISREHIRLIETKDDQEISFMTESAIEDLKEISKELLFVPTTTRTIDQYRRISLFQSEVLPKYAVVSNGGNLLIDGELDLEWSQIVREKMNRECGSSHDVFSKFEEIASMDWVISQRIADDLFGYSIIDPNQVPEEKLYDFTQWLESRNWNISLQGRKLYLVPKCVCKWEAVAHVGERENVRNIAAAGDSLLDLTMLQRADYSFSPYHGEIYKTFDEEDEDVATIGFIKKQGIKAAEEILKNIKFFVEENKTSA